MSPTRYKPDSIHNRVVAVLLFASGRSSLDERAKQPVGRV